MRSSTLGRFLDDVVVQHTPRKIFPSSVKGGRRAAVLVVGKRGRYVRYRIPVRGSVTDIAIMPTIRSAIMHSIKGKIEIKKSDIREKVRRRKVSILLMLVVDGSSSMVERGRLATVRSILDDIFMDTYQKRDRMAIVHCGGGEANLLLSFAGNIEAGRQALEKAPWGGTDSLSEGIAMAGEVVMHRLRIEKNAMPVFVVLSDGKFSRPEMEALSNNLEGISERAGILCVDVCGEAGDEAAPLCEMSESLDIGYMPSEEMTEPAPLPSVEELGSVLKGLAIMTVNPRCGPALLEGFGTDAIGMAATLIEERLWDIQEVIGCPAGCAPPDATKGPDMHGLCPYCRIVHAAGKMRTRKLQMPLVQSDATDMERLLGHVYLWRVVEPGLMSAARNGLLLLTPPSMSEGLEEALAEAYTHGTFSPVGAGPKFHLPAGRKVALFLPKDGDGKGLLGNASMLHATMERDPRFLATNLRMMREATLSPAMTLREIRARFAPLLDPLKAAIEILPSVKASDDDLAIISKASALLAPDDAGLPLRTLEAARAFSALAGRKTVSRDDIRSALSLNLEGTRASEELLPFINEALLDRMGPLLSSMFTDRTAIVLRAPPARFLDGLRARLEGLAPNIKAMKGCENHCAVDGNDGLCPECRIVSQVGKHVMGEVSAPIVTVGPGDGPDTLMSRSYIRYKVIHGKLARAHRGVLIVEDAGHLDPDNALLLAHAIDGHRAPLSDRPDSHPFNASVVAVLGEGEALHPALAQCLPLELDPSELIDGELLVTAAFKMLLGDRQAAPAARPIDAAVEEPHTQEQVLDLLVRLTASHFHGTTGADISLLRTSRALARSRDGAVITEGDLGASASFFKGTA